jgi:hypothetical protein
LSALKYGLANVSAINTVKAATLIATRTALTLALSLVPMISKPVTSRAMASAGKLMNPPAAPPNARGPALSQGGKWTPRNWLRMVPVKYPDQPTETAPAAIAYSMINAQPTVQARNSPRDA